MLIDQWYIFSGKMSIDIFCQFLIRLFIFLSLNCKRSLYVLDISPYHIHDLQIFSLILRGVFNFFPIVSFET